MSVVTGVLRSTTPPLSVFEVSPHQSMEFVGKSLSMSDIAFDDLLRYTYEQ